MSKFNTLLWLSLILLLVSSLIYPNRETIAKYTGMAGWSLFGLFWTLMTPTFLFGKDSLIEGFGCLIAFPIGIFFAYLTYKERLNVLYRLGRGMSIMGLIYFPISWIEPLRQYIMELVAIQTVYIVELLFGQPLEILQSTKSDFMTRIYYVSDPGGGPLFTHIELACTGLGSIAIVVGVISILKEPIKQRLVAGILASILIYIFNLLRTVFITAAFGGQWFQYFESPIMSFTGYQDPRIASFFIADKVISQSLSVVVLVSMFIFISHYFDSLRVMTLDIIDEFRNGM